MTTAIFVKTADLIISMESINLICNYRNCKRVITQHAYVTLCSHIFCYDHGVQIFNNDTKKCPNCSELFQSSDDLQCINLCPSETTKSLTLAGLSPDLIMEMSQKALNFWTYQVVQKQLFLESNLKHSNATLDSMRIDFDNMRMQLNAEILALKRKLTSETEEKEAYKKRSEELVFQLSEKSRAFTKLKSQHELLRRTLIPRVHNPDESQVDVKIPQNFTSPYGHMLLRRSPSNSNKETNSKGFFFNLNTQQ